MMRGMATDNCWAHDLEAAKDWYAELLGIDPYFQRPGYDEFRVGDYQHELGLIDSRYAPEGYGAGAAAPSCTGTSRTWVLRWRGCCRWVPKNTSQ